MFSAFIMTPTVAYGSHKLGDDVGQLGEALDGHYVVAVWIASDSLYLEVGVVGHGDDHQVDALDSGLDSLREGLLRVDVRLTVGDEDGVVWHVPAIAISGGEHVGSQHAEGLGGVCASLGPQDPADGVEDVLLGLVRVELEVHFGPVAVGHHAHSYTVGVDLQLVDHVPGVVEHDVESVFTD